MSDRLSGIHNNVGYCCFQTDAGIQSVCTVIVWSLREPPCARVTKGTLGNNARSTRNVRSKLKGTHPSKNHKMCIISSFIIFHYKSE